MIKFPLLHEMGHFGLAMASSSIVIFGVKYSRIMFYISFLFRKQKVMLCLLDIDFYNFVQRVA